MNNPFVINGTPIITEALASGTGHGVLTIHPSTGEVTSIAAIDTSTFVSKTLASANILVGNGSNVATAVSMSGHATIDNTGLITIGGGVITNAHINAGAAIASTKLSPPGVDTQMIFNDTNTFGVDTGFTYNKTTNTLTVVNLDTATTIGSGYIYRVGGTDVSPADGGTGISSYAIGDILYASGATTLSKLADIAIGNALISGGVATAPSWGKIGLTTHVSGVLPIANGGTNLSALGTALQVLRVNAGATSLEYATIASGVGGSTGSTDNAILRADGTGGSTLQNSQLIINDSGDLTIGTDADTTRSIIAGGSSSDVALTIASKGSSGLSLACNSGVGASGFQITGALGSEILIIQGADIRSIIGTNATNTVAYAMDLRHDTGNPPATGIGTGLRFTTETAAGNHEIGSTIESVTTDVTSTSEDFDLVLKTMTAGAAASEKLRISSAYKITSDNVQINGGVQYLSTTVGQSTSNTDTSILGTGIGSKTFAANTLTEGTMIRLKASGRYLPSAVIPEAFTVTIKLGSTTLADTTAAVTNVATSQFWSIDVTISIKTVGVGGTLGIAGGLNYIINATSPSLNAAPLDNTTGAGTVDTTISNDLDLLARWGDADVHLFQCFVATIEVYKPRN